MLIRTRRNLGIARIALLSILPSLSHAAIASEGNAKINIARGVDITGQDSDGLMFDVELDCGDRLRGIVAHETKSQVGVAAVVERQTIHCGIATRKVSVTLPFFRADAHEFVSMPDLEEDSRISFNEASINVRQSLAEFGWDNSSCRKPLGVFLTVDDQGSLEAAIAFTGSKDSKKLGCAGGRSQLSLTTLATEQVTSLKQLLKPKKMQDLYALRVVAPSQVKVDSLGGLQVTWKSRCQEVFVGVLFGGAAHQKVGVVTAYLPNVDSSCKELAGTLIESKKDLGKMVLLSKTASPLKALSEVEARTLSKLSYDLTLQSPSLIEIVKPTNKLRVSLPVTCQHQLGVVVGADGVGNTSLASLQIKSDKSCLEKNAQRPRGIDLPLIALQSSDSNQKLFALRVKGSPAH
jgi:hypothetical protein